MMCQLNIQIFKPVTEDSCLSVSPSFFNVKPTQSLKLIDGKAVVNHLCV